MVERRIKTKVDTAFQSFKDTMRQYLNDEMDVITDYIQNNSDNKKNLIQLINDTKKNLYKKLIIIKHFLYLMKILKNENVLRIQLHYKIDVQH